jgi:hypothetical protein
VSDRIVRFSEASWQEVEALPEPLRWTVQRAIFHLLDEPVPTQDEVSGEPQVSGFRRARCNKN